MSERETRRQTWIVSDMKRDASGNRRSVIPSGDLDPFTDALRKQVRARRVATRRELTRRRRSARRDLSRDRLRRTRHAPSPSKDQGRVLWPWVSAALVLVISVAAWSRPELPDPHYLRARDLIENHELGKAPEALNYGDPVYTEAIDELRRVKRSSISSPSARQLEEELLAAVDAFREERQAGRSRADAVRAAARQRAATLERAQRFETGVGRAPHRSDAHD